MTDETREPWRCGNCNLLVYNLEERDGKLYPAPGAPQSNYLNAKYPSICTLCYQMYNNIAESRYWMKLHTDWEDSLKMKSKNGWSD